MVHHVIEQAEPHAVTVDAMQRALEAAGVEFEPDGSVRPSAGSAAAAGPVTAPLGTLAEIDAAIARAEATLADYRQDLAEREAEGRDTARSRELVRLVEKRLALLHERRQIAEAAEGSGGSGSREGRRP